MHLLDTQGLIKHVFNPIRLVHILKYWYWSWIIYVFHAQDEGNFQRAGLKYPWDEDIKLTWTSWPRVWLKFSPNVMDIWSCLVFHQVLFLAWYKVEKVHYPPPLTQFCDDFRKHHCAFKLLADSIRFPLVFHESSLDVGVGRRTREAPLLSSFCVIPGWDADGVSERPADMQAQRMWQLPGQAVSGRS